MNPLTPFKKISETDTTVLYDGGNGLGQVVSCLAMKKCIEKAKKSNAAIAAVKHRSKKGSKRRTGSTNTPWWN